MDNIVFEYDSEKDLIYQRKHGLSFATAINAFTDLQAIVIEDQRDYNGEQRFKLLGKLKACLLIAVVYTYRDRNGNEVIRIISARRATKTEAKIYEHR
ncbi:MAG: BrnT family toxin [Succinivibrio sp.]|nr:BrnT family toxin [Succinivibrio sp.]